MIAYIIQRLFHSILVILAVGLIAFSLFRFVGDPVNNMVGQDTTIEEREVLRESLGLNDPILIQFTRYMANVASGELGISYRLGRPVGDLFKIGRAHV